MRDDHQRYRRRGCAARPGLRRRGTLGQSSPAADWMVEAVPYPLILRDQQGRVVRWNQAAAQLYGWTHAEVTGRDLAVILRTELLAGSRGTRSYATEPGGIGAVRQYHHDGTPLIVTCHAVQQPTPDGWVLEMHHLVQGVPESSAPCLPEQLDSYVIDLLGLYDDVVTAAHTAPHGAGLLEHVLDTLAHGLKSTIAYIDHDPDTSAQTHEPRIWVMPPGALVETADDHHLYRLPPESDLSVRVHTTRRAHWCSTGDTTLPRGLCPPGGMPEAGGVIVVPLPVRDQVVAMMVFVVPTRSTPDHACLATLTRIGQQVGLAMERCRANDQLRMQEARFRSIMDLLSDYTYSYQIMPDGTLIREWITEAFFEITQYAPSESAEWETLIHPDDRALAMARYGKMLAGETDITEFRIVTKEGEVRWLRDHAVPHWDATHQRVVGLTGAARHITERKVLEETLRNLVGQLESRVTARTAELAASNQQLSRLSEELRTSHDLLRTLFDSISDGLVVLDQQGHILEINRGCAALVGRPASALIGQPWHAICTVWDIPGAVDIVATARHTALPQQQRLNYRLSAGMQRLFDMHVWPTRDSSATVEKMIVRIRDVTEQVQLEATIIQNERFAAAGRLAAMIAHEINTPLQSVQHCLYFAHTGSDEERPAYLDLARDEIRRVSGILRRLLSLYHHTDTPTSLDMNELLERVLLLLGGALVQHGIAVERAFSSDLLLVHGYSDQLTQVLINLIINAIDAMAEGGTLRLRTSIAARTALSQDPSPMIIAIEITDTGAGLLPEQQQQIFAPFYTTKPQGTGLGLTISAQIVTQHGGTLHVESSVGTGTTFHLELPYDRR